MKKILHLTLILAILNLQSQETEYQKNLAIIENTKSTEEQIKAACDIIDTIDNEYKTELKNYNDVELKEYNDSISPIIVKLTKIGDALIGLAKMKTGVWNKSIEDATKDLSDADKKAYINQRKKSEDAFLSSYLKDLGFQKPTLNEEASDKTAEMNKYLKKIQYQTTQLQKKQSELIDQINAIKRPNPPSATRISKGKK
jgi:hypothetical protein